MEVTAQMVKDLRALTGAGVLDCRKTLDAAGGDFEQAVAMLRDRGLAVAAKKAERETKEGLIGHYVHMGSKVGALVEVNCESDFVARTENFQALCKDLAMQVVAAQPKWVRIEEVPADVVEQVRSEAFAEAAGKPANVVEKIVDGKVAKFCAENVLLEQPYIKDESINVKDLITQTIAKIGENIVVRRFVRFEVGN